MSYKIYTTKAIIIKVKGMGESDKIVSTFTKDFGRLNIIAKGTRGAKSKMGPHLDILNHVKISFIAGKEFWRLVNVEKISSFKFLSKNIQNLHLSMKAAEILERLTQGEEKNENLWAIFLEFLKFADSVSRENNPIKIAQKITVLKILEALGYADNSKGILAEISLTPKLNYGCIKKYENRAHEIQKIINNGLKESGLY